MTTNLFKGTFNYSGEVSILHRYAKSSVSALRVFCFALSRKYHVSLNHMINYFNGGKDNFTIEEVTKK